MVSSQLAVPRCWCYPQALAPYSRHQEWAACASKSLAFRILATSSRAVALTGSTKTRAGTAEAKPVPTAEPVQPPPCRPQGPPRGTRSCPHQQTHTTAQSSHDAASNRTNADKALHRREQCRAAKAAARRLVQITPRLDGPNRENHGPDYATPRRPEPRKSRDA
jgi:hypothetical protein